MLQLSIYAPYLPNSFNFIYHCFSLPLSSFLLNFIEFSYYYLPLFYLYYFVILICSTITITLHLYILTVSFNRTAFMPFI